MIRRPKKEGKNETKQDETRQEKATARHDKKNHKAKTGARYLSLQEPRQILPWQGGDDTFHDDTAH